MSVELVLSFPRLFHHQGLTLVIVACYKLAVARPLELAFGISLNDKVFIDFSKALLLLEPSSLVRALSWLREKVLQLLL